jgi:hypothetical protein
VIGVTGKVVHVGCDEHAATRGVRARARRQPNRLLGKLGGCSRCPTRVRRSRRFFEDRSNGAVWLGRGER